MQCQIIRVTQGTVLGPPLFLMYILITSVTQLPPCQTIRRRLRYVSPCEEQQRLLTTLS